MSLLSNPPQPVPAPIRNHVNYEDRVSILLNRAGSSAKNPIVGTQRHDPVGGAFATVVGNGAVLRLKFGMAEYSETINSATIQEVNDDGTSAAGAISIKALFTTNTSTMAFSADLIAGDGGQIPSGSSAKRSLIRIHTNLNRKIEQQVYVQDAPENIVVVRGAITSTDSRYRSVSSAEIDGSETFPIPFSFFPTWNDEIGRQHGASGVATELNIAKPYGGMKTVQVWTTSGVSLVTDLTGEIPIEELTSIDFTPTNSGQMYNLQFQFRAETGSADFVLGYAYLIFSDCVAGSGESPDVPPSTGHPPGGDVIDGPDIIVDPEGYGTDSGGTTQTGYRYFLTGYKGGNSEAGPGTAIANVASGTQTETYPTAALTQKTITLNATLQEADLIIAEIQSEDGTVKGNSIIYATATADTGLLPSPPTVAVAGSDFNFTTDLGSVTISDFGWPNTDATVYCRSIGAGITNTGAAQSSSDTFADVTSGELKSVSFPYSASTPATISTLAFGFATAPKSVAIWAANDFGSSDPTYIHFDDDGSVDGGIAAAPTISTLALVATNTRLTFTISTGHNQTASFTYQVTILPKLGGTALTQTGTFANTTTSATIALDSGNQAVNGHYTVYLEGQNGNSNTLFLDNVSGF